MHVSKVERIASSLRRRRSRRPLSLRKSGPGHHVPKRHDRRRDDEVIDLSDLDSILEIDPVARTCVAEPGVAFEDLVAATLRYGLVPQVVPELRRITIGGAVSGCALESRSFMVGGFHDTCVEYEVLTAEGERVVCRRGGENALLFEMMQGSFGTLGVLTKLRFRLMKAKPFVKVTYERYHTLDAYLAAIEDHRRRADVDFMDGIIHARDLYVLSLGTFVDRAPFTNRYDWTKVYWKSTASRSHDYLETTQYFFRYDRGVTNVHPKTFLGRLLFGKLLSSHRLLALAERFHRFLPEKAPEVTLDLFVPISRAHRYLAWHDQAIGFYPLWCVPYRRVGEFPWIRREVFAGIDDELFLDLAIYGCPQPEGRDLYAEIEQVLLDVPGVKTLISHNRYDEATFWRIFDRENYTAVKQRMDAQGVLRDLYTKTCRTMQGLPDRP